MRSATWTCSGGSPTCAGPRTARAERSPCRHFYIDPLQQWIDDNGLVGSDGLFGYSGRWSVNQAIERVCDTANLKAGKSLKLAEAGGWASIQIVAETYGHLERSHVEDALRETGNAMLTKMVPMLSKPETAGQVMARSGRTTFAQRHQEAAFSRTIRGLGWWALEGSNL